MDNTRHGSEMNRWTPDIEGADFDLKPILEPLAPYRDYLTVISGLENKSASGPVHAITPATWLSCQHPRQSHAPYAAVTVDQIAARALGQDTPLPSLELATEESGGSAACDGTYGCSYGSTISFRTPTTPLPMEFDPRRAFEKIFGRGRDATERREIADDYVSLLDMVREEATDLSRKLGAEDRGLMHDYLDSVREIERRVQLLETQDLSKLNLPEIPVELPDFDQHLRLMFDMIAAAYQANVTRVATFMMAAEVSNQPYSHIGIPDAFHPLSHHAENKASIEKLAVLQRYHSEVFAEFLGKLARMPDGDAGTVLDNSLFLYGSNMSNSNSHNHFPLPSLVVNRGLLKGNQHIRYPDRTPFANLHLTLLNRAGIPTDSVGDSTGELAEI